MESKNFYVREFPSLNVSISEVYDKDGRKFFRLVVLHLDSNPHVEEIHLTYNGAVIGLLRLLSNNMAAV